MIKKIICEMWSQFIVYLKIQFSKENQICLYIWVLGEIFYVIILFLLLDQLSLSYYRILYCYIRFFKVKEYGKSCKHLWTNSLLMSQTGGRKFVSNIRLVGHFVFVSTVWRLTACHCLDCFLLLIIATHDSFKKKHWFLSTSVFSVFSIYVLWTLKILIYVFFSLYFIQWIWTLLW